MMKNMLQTCISWQIESDNEVISLNDEFDLSYNELHDAFKILYDEYKKLGS